MSVLALLLTLLLSIVNGSTQLWRTNENRVDSFREARAAINLISHDLSSIYGRRKPTYFYTQKDHRPDLPVRHAGMDGSVFFLTALPLGSQETGNQSDLCTVGYYLGYDKTSLTGKGTSSYNLYRYFRGSDETFDAISTSQDILNGVPNPLETAPTSANFEVVAKNITGFTVVPYSIPPYDPKAPTAKRNPVPFEKSDQFPLPDMLEITIKAISNDAAKRFQDNREAWENPSSPTHQKEERTFQTRIYLDPASYLKATPAPSPSPTPP